MDVLPRRCSMSDFSLSANVAPARWLVASAEPFQTGLHPTVQLQGGPPMPTAMTLALASNDVYDDAGSAAFLGYGRLTGTA